MTATGTYKLICRKLMELPRLYSMLRELPRFFVYDYVPGSIIGVKIEGSYKTMQKVVILHLPSQGDRTRGFSTRETMALHAAAPLISQFNHESIRIFN